MKTRFACLTAFAAAHLVLVICGASHFELAAPDNLVGRTLATYGAVSGADTSYGFFAPRVAPELRVEFVCTDAKEKTWTDDGDWGRTSEAKLRLLSSVSMVNFDELRDGVAASWAAAMFGRYPTAKKVEMHVEFQDLPTLSQYQTGCRPQWLPLYEAKFTRDVAL